MIPRNIQENVIKVLNTSNKVIIVLGPRQAGKTTLIQKIQSELAPNKFLWFNCDLEEHFNLINTTSLEQLARLLSPINYLFIDEAQRLDNAGLTLKIIHDNFPNLKILVTGSSSFEIKNSLSDALTGRYFNFTLYPLSYTEMSGTPKSLANILTYGGYPDIYLQTDVEMKKALLSKIAESYLFKDILSFSKIRNSQALINLARALAFQVGSEMNENELASRLKIDRKTLVSYLEILEKSFVIMRLHPYSQNPRREIGRRYKVYFLDLGIRNQLIGQFNPLELRQDYGKIWENFLIIERRKSYSATLTPPPCFFWRNLNGSEVDYLELDGGKIKAYEFKLGSSKKVRTPPSFKADYKVDVSIITPGNYQDFIKQS
jgi:hypothetical protein